LIIPRTARLSSSQGRRRTSTGDEEVEVEEKYFGGLERLLEGRSDRTCYHCSADNLTLSSTCVEDEKFLKRREPKTDFNKDIHH